MLWRAARAAAWDATSLATMPLELPRTEAVQARRNALLPACRRHEAELLLLLAAAIAAAPGAIERGRALMQVASPSLPFCSPAAAPRLDTRKAALNVQRR